MKYDPAIHKRKSIRLKGYDYSQAGLYFITICVKNRESLFGRIENGEMVLNDAGQMIQTEWQKLPQRFPGIELHEFIVMPNHFHGILEIVGAALVAAPITTGQPSSGATTRVAPTEKTLGDMIGAFKSITTDEYISGVKKLAWEPFEGKLWQRDYYEHIIRNEQSYETISNYIINNPAQWQVDKFLQAMIDYDKFEKSLKHLQLQFENYKTIDERDDLGELEKEAIAESVIQRFETCYDTLWKVLKRYLTEELGVPEMPNSPKPIFQIAFENKLFNSDIKQWKSYADARIDTAHDYSGSKAEDALKLMNDFIEDAIDLYITMSKKIFE